MDTIERMNKIKAGISRSGKNTIYDTDCAIGERKFLSAAKRKKDELWDSCFFLLEAVRSCSSDQVLVWDSSFESFQNFWANAISIWDQNSHDYDLKGQLKWIEFPGSCYFA